LIGRRTARIYFVVEALMVAGCVLLAWEIHGRLQRGLGSAENRIATRSTAAQASSAQADGVAMRDLESFRNFVERPLFSPSRRPPPPVTPEPMVEAAPPPAQMPKFELLGIVGPEGARLAILRKPGATEALRLSVGDKVEGWTVKLIEPDRVLLATADRQVEVAFPEFGKGSSSGP
jgi:hypothetical protein